MTTTINLLRPLSNRPLYASNFHLPVYFYEVSTNTNNTSSFPDRDLENGGLSSFASSIRSVIRSSSDSFASDSKLTPSVLTFSSILEPDVLEEGEEGGEGEFDDDESRNGDEQPTPTTPQQTAIEKGQDRLQMSVGRNLLVEVEVLLYSSFTRSEKSSPASVPIPGSFHSSISGGSTTSNLTSRRVVRRMVLKKKSVDVVESTTTPEVPDKELDVKEGKGKVVVETEKDADKDKDGCGYGYGCCRG